jgi:hypothetical protein
METCTGGTASRAVARRRVGGGQGLHAPRTGRQMRSRGVWCCSSFKSYQLLWSLHGWLKESHRGDQVS